MYLGGQVQRQPQQPHISILSKPCWLHFTQWGFKWTKWDHYIERSQIQLIFHSLSIHHISHNIGSNNFETVSNCMTKHLRYYIIALFLSITTQKMQKQFLHSFTCMWKHVHYYVIDLLWSSPTQKNAQNDETISKQFLHVSENRFIIMLSVCSDLSLHRQCANWWNYFYTVFTCTWKHVHYYKGKFPKKLLFK